MLFSDRKHAVQVVAGRRTAPIIQVRLKLMEQGLGRRCSIVILVCHGSSAANEEIKWAASQRVPFSFI